MDDPCKELDQLGHFETVDLVWDSVEESICGDEITLLTVLFVGSVLSSSLARRLGGLLPCGVVADGLFTDLPELLLLSSVAVLKSLLGLGLGLGLLLGAGLARLGFCRFGFCRLGLGLATRSLSRPGTRPGTTTLSRARGRAVSV